MTDNPKAFSVLGYEAKDADTDARPDFAAYAPTYEAAQGDRDHYQAANPRLHTWRIVRNVPGAMAQ